MMKFFKLIFLWLLLPAAVSAQIVTVAPADFGLDDEVTITYNASLGNKALKGYKGPIYVHTGVVTEGSTSGKDWKYVQGTWGKADERLRMKELAMDQYQITFKPRDFYEIPDNEKVKKLAFVFRDAKGTKVGKMGSGEDIYIPVNQQANLVVNVQPKRYQSHSLSNGILTVKTDQGDILIQAYDEGITKVSLSSAQHKPADTSYSVILKPQNINVQLVEKDKYLLYDAPLADVYVQKNPVRLKFIVNADTLLAEDGGFYEQDAVVGATFKLKDNEALYGSGSRAIPFDRRGKELKIYNEAHYGYTYGAPVLNVTIPMLISSKGYGVFFDNYYAGEINAGAEKADIMDFRFRGGPSSYYFIAGEEYGKLMNRYTKLTGKQPIPPLWALGFIQSKYGYKTEKEAREIVKLLQDQDFPIDALVLDLYWFGVEGDMGRLDWDRTKWPNAEAMMEELEKSGVKTIIITEPYFTKQSGNFDVLKEKGFLTTTEEGKPYLIEDFWAGAAGLIDITKPGARAWMREYYENRIKEGVHGWWSDLGEPENHPAGMRHAGGKEPYEVHNIYSLIWAQLLFDIYRENFNDQRVFNLIRSGYAGMQRYGTFPWSGDIERSWNGLQAQIPIMLGMSMSGIGYMHSDLGGFTGGGKQQELYARWLQFGAFTPIMRAHGSGGIPPEPAFYDEPYKSIVRDYIKLRYSMMPYLYTLAWKNATEGLPIALPMNFFDPNNASLRNINDQYFWGKNMIVAPVLHMQQRERNVILPEGQWVDFWTNKVYSGNQTINMEAPLERMPMLMRGGSFLPMVKPLKSLSNLSTDSLIVKYYPVASVNSSEFTMYVDNGSTPNPEKYQLVNFRGESSGNDLLVTLSKEGPGFEGAPERRFVQFEIINLKQAPASVQLNGNNLNMLTSLNAVNRGEGAYYDKQSNKLYVSFNWAGNQAKLAVEGAVLGTEEVVQQRAKTLALATPYPNPGQDEVRIFFDVNKRGNYGLEVTDMNGRVVFIKMLPNLSVGRHMEVLDAKGNNLQSGTYVVTLKGVTEKDSKKIVLMK